MELPIALRCRCAAWYPVRRGSCPGMSAQTDRAFGRVRVYVAGFCATSEKLRDRFLDVQQRVSICTGTGLGSALPRLHWDRVRRTGGASHPSRQRGRWVARPARVAPSLSVVALLQERDLESSVQRLMNERSY